MSIILEAAKWGDRHHFNDLLCKKELVIALRKLLPLLTIHKVRYKTRNRSLDFGVSWLQGFVQGNLFSLRQNMVAFLSNVRRKCRYWDILAKRMICRKLIFIAKMNSIDAENFLPSSQHYCTIGLSFYLSRLMPIQRFLFQPMWMTDTKRLWILCAIAVGTFKSTWAHFFEDAPSASENSFTLHSARDAEWVTGYNDLKKIWCKIAEIRNKVETDFASHWAPSAFNIHQYTCQCCLWIVVQNAVNCSRTSLDLMHSCSNEAEKILHLIRTPFTVHCSFKGCSAVPCIQWIGVWG